MSDYGVLLDDQFGSTVMYYFVFDEQTKNLSMFEQLVERYDIVYKIVVEVIYQNNRFKVDYDLNTGKDLLKQDDCMIAKLYVIKRSETKSNMIYYRINNYMLDYLTKYR